MAKSDIAQKEMIAEYVRCSNGVSGFLHFAFNHCYSIDNETGEVKLLPRTWEFLRELAIDIFSGVNLARKKSRRLLITWFVMAYELWALTFKKNYPMFNLSKKEKLVDDGGENSTPNSLHGKIYFMWKKLPPYLQKKMTFAHLRIDCPSTGSFIVGESSNMDAGRGGGYAWGFIDEAAFIEYGETVFAAFKLACKQIFLVSTSNGPNTMFCRVSKMAEQTKGWSYKFLHVLLRPDRDQAYLVKCQEEMLPAQYSREIEGKDIGNVSALVWPMFDFNLHVVSGLFKQNVPVELSFDFGAGDPTAVKIIQHVGSVCNIVDEVESNNATPEQIRDLITYKLVMHGLINAMAEGQPINEYKEYLKREYSRIPAYGDPAGNAKLQDNSDSVIQQYAALGVRIMTKNATNVPIGIMEVARRLNKRKIFVDSGCTMTIDELSGCHYKVNERTGEIMDGQRYSHDKLSHGADATRYWCENNPCPAEAEQAPVYHAPERYQAPMLFHSRLRSAHG